MWSLLESRWLGAFIPKGLHEFRLPLVQNSCRKLRRTGAVATRSWQGGFCLMRQKIPKQGRRFFWFVFFRRVKKMNKCWIENVIINSINIPFFFASPKKERKKSRLIFTSLKTTQIPYPADSQPLRLCIPLVALVGCRAPLPSAAAFTCFTTDVKSMPLLTFIVIIYALSLRVILEHPSAKGLYREVFETATWLTINALTSKTSRYDWIPATAGIQSLEVTVFIPENERVFSFVELVLSDSRRISLDKTNRGYEVHELPWNKNNTSKEKTGKHRIKSLGHSCILLLYL